MAKKNLDKIFKIITGELPSPASLLGKFIFKLTVEVFFLNEYSLYLQLRPEKLGYQVKVKFFGSTMHKGWGLLLSHYTHIDICFADQDF